MRSQPFHRAARFSPSAALARIALTFAASLLLVPTPTLYAQGAATTLADAQRRHATAAAPANTPTPASTPATMPAPDPRLAPDSVVTIVLDAFARIAQDVPTSGIDIAYAFTAPGNRAVIGSVERFTDVVQDGAYKPLLGHRRAVRSPMKIDGDRATQRVVVTTVDGAQVAFTFRLARQTDGEFKDCWMTERVTREPPSRLAAPQLALGPVTFTRGGSVTGE